MMDKKWAVVFDFDGTLISKSYGSLYDVIDSNGGVTPACHQKAVKMRKHYLALARAGKLTKKHQEKWLVDSLRLYVDSGLSVHKMREILSRVQLRAGVRDCLLQLQARGVPVAIISYGVFQFIEEVLLHHGLKHLVHKIYSADLKIGTDAAGTVTGFSKETFVFPFNKGLVSREFADLYGVPYENILAVGDSPNGDKELGHLMENRLGIARDKSEKERLLEVMGSAMVTESFDRATDWLLDRIDSE